MKPIKKMLSEAFSDKEEAKKLLDELDPEVQDHITKEVERQLKKLVQEIIVPEIKQVISEALRAELQGLNPTGDTSQENFPELYEAYHGELPMILEEEILPLDQELAEVQGAKAEQDTRPPLSTKDVRLGIDFGTTTTVVSLRIGEEQPVSLSIGRDGQNFMPSVVYFNQGDGDLSDRVLIGEDAEAMTISDPIHVIRSIKRCFGCDSGKCSIQGIQNGVRFPWCDGKGRIQVTQTETLHPSEVAFYIVQEALTRAVGRIKENYSTDLEISNIGSIPINMGCGAKFSFRQRQIVLDNAQSFGFAEISIKNVVEEPILAGLAFSRLVELSQSVGRSLIYDFGGGTLDIAVVDVVRKKNKPFITVLSTSGDNWLGGDDIDKIVLDEFVRQISSETKCSQQEVMNRLTLVDFVSLRNRAKTAKERLSNSEQYKDSLSLENLGLVFLTLSRDEFETVLMASPLIERSFIAVLKALKLAYALDVAKEKDLLDVATIRNLQLEEAVKKVDRVVLVGGVTKIPLIQREMKRLFGSANVVEEKVFDPISAVSIGAAYPREADHFSISSPPYGFYLEGRQLDKIKHEYLLAPYTYLDFFKDIYNNSIPAVNISFDIPDTWNSVILLGWEPFTEDVEKVKEIGRLNGGSYQFHIGLDGSISLTSNHSKPQLLGNHRYTHPLQKLIKEQKEHRKAEANKYPNRSLSDDYKRLMNEN